MLVRFRNVRNGWKADLGHRFEDAYPRTGVDGPIDAKAFEAQQLLILGRCSLARGEKGQHDDVQSL